METAVMVVVLEGKVTWLVMVEGVQAAVLVGMEAGMLLASDRGTALGSASTTTTMTVGASMVLASIPTWGRICRIMAQVGITSAGDEVDTVAMVAVEGLVPTIQVTASSVLYHGGCSSKDPCNINHQCYRKHLNSNR